MPDVPIGVSIPRASKDPEYAAYVARHRRVRAARGHASGYPCRHCGGSATTWAQVHGTDGESPDDYMPLCWPCHATYDNFMANFAKRPRNHSPETRKKLSEARRRRDRDAEWREKDRLRRQANAPAECAKGHPYGPPGKNGKRYCKICKHDRVVERRALLEKREADGREQREAPAETPA